MENTSKEREFRKPVLRLTNRGNFSKLPNSKDKELTAQSEKKEEEPTMCPLIGEELAKTKSKPLYLTKCASTDKEKTAACRIIPVETENLSDGPSTSTHSDGDECQRTGERVSSAQDKSDFASRRRFFEAIENPSYQTFYRTAQTIKKENLATSTASDADASSHITTVIYCPGHKEKPTERKFKSFEDFKTTAASMEIGNSTRNIHSTGHVRMDERNTGDTLQSTSTYKAAEDFKVERKKIPKKKVSRKQKTLSCLIDCFAQCGECI